MNQTYTFNLQTNNLELKFFEFYLPYKGLCTGNIQIMFNDLTFMFKADISPTDIKKIDNGKSFKIVGWNWNIEVEKNNESNLLMFNYNANKHPTEKTLLDLHISFKTEISIDDLNTFIEDYNYFVEWIELKSN